MPRKSLVSRETSSLLVVFLLLLLLLLRLLRLIELYLSAPLERPIFSFRRPSESLHLSQLAPVESPFSYPLVALVPMRSN